MFNLETNTQLITPPSKEYVAPYAYINYGSDPNQPISENLRRLNNWRGNYVNGRIDIFIGLLTHDIAHAVFRELEIIPNDDFDIIEILVSRWDEVEEITSDVRSLIALPAGECRTQHSGFFAGYLENPSKLPFLYKHLNRLRGEIVQVSDVNSRALLSIYPELIEIVCFYYECMNINKDLLSGIKKCLHELQEKNGVLIKNAGLYEPKTLFFVKADKTHMTMDQKKEYEAQEKASIDSWNEILKTIKDFKANNPEINEKILRYSIRNMTVLFEMPADFIANYFDITLEQVNQYIREDSFCQRLPLIKETLESLDPERFKEFKEGSY